MTLPTELKRFYVDDDCNFIFRDFLLPEARISVAPQSTELGELTSCLSKLATYKEESVKAILEHFLIEKFSSKNKNVEAWCESFKRESDRFKLTSQRQTEIFKSCLESSMSDWFSIKQRKRGLNAAWKDWKSDFDFNFW